MIALAMWRTSFGGVNDFGVGSAIAVFLFLLVIPVLRSTSAASGGRPDGDRQPPQLRRREREERSRREILRFARQGARCTSSCSSSALLWLVPTLGLFFTSLLARRRVHRAGLVERSSREPSLATFENYQAVFDNDDDHERALDDAS